MISCSLKTLNECPRPCTTRCVVQPQTTPAPVPRFTIRDQLIIISFGFAMMAIGYLALSEADRQFKAENLRNQEQVTTWKR